MAKTPKHLTREAWLTAAAKILGPRVIRAAKETDPKAALPEGLQLLTSFPSSGAKSNAIGQFFSKSWTVGSKARYIIISPILGESDRVLDVLLHELTHACLGIAKGHGAKFKEVVTRLGLVGRVTATVAGAELKKELAEIAEALGPYPHVQMVTVSGSRGGGEGDGKRYKAKGWVRLVSPVNPEYAIMLRRTQYAKHGAPKCPISGRELGVAAGYEEE